MKQSAVTASEIPRLKRYTWIFAGVWTMAVVSSLVWNLFQVRNRTLDAARIAARMAYEKDVIARNWNSRLGGVYVTVSKAVGPNPHLTAPNRDVTTNSGTKLTLVNPAHMTRMLHEALEKESGIRGHITSSHPIRPQNKPDAWEEAALNRFQHGEREVSSVEKLEDGHYLRLMRPLITESTCLKCHTDQGYRIGDIRGGISVAVPMESLWESSRKRILNTSVSHGILWMLGIIGLVLGMRSLSSGIRAKENTEKLLLQANRNLEEEARRSRLAEIAKGNLVADLEEALKQVKKLSGLLPICSACKKIRDDKGYWQEVEEYVSTHSEAEFSHSLCPECAKRLYPDFFPDK